MSRERRRSQSSQSSSTRPRPPTADDYAAADPDDFCNAFWSAQGDMDDSGVDVLLQRLKNGSKSIEDLRNFYKERASIEEEYAKRLFKLSRLHLGRDEVGSTKAALDHVRGETAKMADAHEKLSVMMRTALEGKTREFEQARENRKRNPLAAIEKALKNKQSQAQMVRKAQEKYKADCVSINGYTAQTSLVQGRDLDKVSAKLDKVQATIQVNEKEYRAYVSALKETTSKWNIDWKAFLDLAQDLEEERLSYMRVSLWEYANGVSYVCVVDDQFCESIRSMLQNCDATEDLVQFVRRNATGNKIADPPEFVDYGAGEYATQPRTTPKAAKFARSSARNEFVYTGQSLTDLANAINPTAQTQAMRSQAATPVSAYDQGNGQQSRRQSQDVRPSRSRANSYHSTGSNVRAEESGAAYGQRAASRSPAPETRNNPPQQEQSSYQPSYIPPRSATPQDYSVPIAKVEPTPAQEARSRATTPVSRHGVSTEANYRSNRNSVVSPNPVTASKTPATSSPATLNFDKPKDDPVARALAALRDPARASEVVEPLPISPLIRNKSRTNTISSAKRQSIPAPSGQSQYSRSRPTSPAPSQAPQRESSPLPQSAAPQQQDAARSRPNSVASFRPVDNMYQQQQQQQQPQPQQQHPIQQQPMGQPNLYASQQAPFRAQQNASPVAYASQSSPAPVMHNRQFQQSTRPVSPRPVSSQSNYNPAVSQQRQSYYGGTPQPAGQLQHEQVIRSQSAASYRTASPAAAPVAAADPYARPPSTTFQQYPHVQAQQQRPVEVNRAASPYAASPIQQQTMTPQQQPAMTPAQIYAAQQASIVGIHTGPTSGTPAPSRPYSATNFAQPAYQQQQPQQQQPQQPQQQPLAAQPYRSHSPAPPPVAQQPQPEGGRPVQFFVRAMYDYEAQIPEEFSFQANDVIAVFATDPDGWWTGELLDETRKRGQGNIFPSNFVTLLE